MGLQEDYERFKNLGSNNIGSYPSYERNDRLKDEFQRDSSNNQRLYNHVNIDSFTQRSPKVSSYDKPFTSSQRHSHQFQSYNKPFDISEEPVLSKTGKPLYHWQPKPVTDHSAVNYSKAFDDYESTTKNRQHYKYGLSSPIKSIPKSSPYSKIQPSKLYKVLNDNSTVRNQINSFQTGPVLDNYKISKPHKSKESTQQGILSRLRGYLNNIGLPDENTENPNVYQTKVKDRLNKKVSFEDSDPAYARIYNRFNHNSADLDNDEVDDTIQQTKKLSTLLSKQREEVLERELNDMKRKASDEKDRNENLIRRHEDETHSLHQSYKERIDHLNGRIADFKVELDRTSYDSDIRKEYETLKRQNREKEQLISDLQIELETIKSQLSRREQDIQTIQKENKTKRNLKQVKMKRESVSNELLLESKQIQLKIDNLEAQYLKLRIDANVSLPSLIKENILDYEKTKRGIEKAIATLKQSKGKIDNSESSQIKSFIDSLTEYLTSSKVKNEVKLESLDKKISSTGNNKESVIATAKLLKKKFSVLLKLKSLNELSRIANSLEEYYEDSLILRKIADKEDFSPYELYEKIKFELDNTLL
ncbi:hypothetical protein DFJ63DRAFT_221484 [Scheffersomyces coipomensis]|uniref:uncharacterized protein n=1 Tax=Scheffersomyces coipomensis TaxID=1788519 RepID=UPI00315D84B3